jgi:hypothetical protein
MSSHLSHLLTNCKTDEYNPYEYYSRRDIPKPLYSPSAIPPHPSSHFLILFREPANDYVPRYVIRDLSDEKRQPRLLRVSLFDITRYVSARQLEAFENRKFLYSDPEFSSIREWIKQCRRETATRLSYPNASSYNRVQSRSTSSQVVIYTSKPINLPASKQIKLSPSSDFVSDGIPRVTTQISSPLSENPSSSEIDHEIEHILEHKDVLGRRYYLVAWKGLPDTRATWLTPDELEEHGFETDGESDTFLEGS